MQDVLSNFYVSILTLTKKKKINPSAADSSLCFFHPLLSSPLLSRTKCDWVERGFCGAFCPLKQAELLRTKSEFGEVRKMALASTVLKEKATSGVLRRLSYNLLQSIDFSSTASSSSATTTSEPSKLIKRRKNKNLFEVVQFLPNWGIGYHMAKTHWSNVSYEITKINLYKDGRHGKAWGLAYKDGIPAPAPKKMSGVHKRCWKYIPNPIKLEGEPKPEAEAA